MQARKRTNKRNGDSFNAQKFLDTAGLARKVVEYSRGESIYSQGEAAGTVMYIQKGGVKLSVVNGSGKEAVVAMFGPTDFFGEGCMAGQSIRMGTTSAVTPTTVLVIQKEELLRVLHSQHELSDHFINYMLAHNIRVEEDLIDQLFNSSEKRLARALLLLARYGEQDQPERVLAKVSQETLASMVGTTRSRINFFHEQIPEARVYRIQRHDQGQQVVAHRRPARVKPRAKKEKACRVKNLPADRRIPITFNSKRRVRIRCAARSFAERRQGDARSRVRQRARL